MLKSIMDNPQRWNAGQVVILRRLAKGEVGYFDRWTRLCIGGTPITSSHSTTPYTLFIRGLIVSDGTNITITPLGRAVLATIDGE